MVQRRLLQYEKQKRLELEQFTEFAAICDCVPPGKPEQPRPPEPDIVLPGSLGLIGIEFTDITLGGRRQRAYEGEQRHRIEKAKKLYGERGNQPISVRFSWAGGGTLSAGNRERDARIICELIEQNPRSGKDLLHEIGDDMSLIRSDLPLTQMVTFEARSWDSADWRDGRFHKVEPCGAVEIQAEIIRKNPAVAGYQVPYSSRWLLLVLEADGPSTWGVVLDGVRHITFDSRFDRVFLFELGHRRWHELNLNGRKAV